MALRNASTDAKNRALADAARLIRAEKAAILAANAKDIEAAKAAGMTAALQDRLLLNDARVEGMAKGLDDIVALPDPVGAEIETKTRPNGLVISRVRVPIGIIGVIYEARPNVTADAGALCIKSGNVVVLRGGSDSFHSSRAIVELLRRALKGAGLPEDCVQLVPTTDRAAVGEMLRATGWLDLIVPRGGRSLIDRVTEESRVPVLRHYDGICHVYVDRDADIAMARDVVANAKMRRVSVCGAAETLLVDRAALDTHLMPVLAKLHELGCEVRGDSRGAEARSQGHARHREGLAHRVPRAGDLGRHGRRRRRRHPPHRDLRQPAHRIDHHRQRGHRAAFPGRGRQRHRHAQCQHPVRRRRRVRAGRGDRHLDQPHACARAGRPGRAHDLQERRARQGHLRP